MFAGLVIAWAISVPILTYLQPAPEGVRLAAHTLAVWRTQVRFIGAGAIGVSAIWTLAKLAKPVVGGLVSTLRVVPSAQRPATSATATSRPAWIVGLTVGCLAVTGWLAYAFVAPHAPRRPSAAADAVRGAVRVRRRFRDCRRRRLHGRADRCVEQPDLRHRHPRRSSPARRSSSCSSRRPRTTGRRSWRSRCS